MLRSRVIFLDWDGTIARKEVANEAAIRRGKVLGVNFSKKYILEAQKTHAHYDLNKKLISDYTGVKDKDLLTIMMTDMFQYQYLGVVNEQKKDIFYNDMIRILRLIKKKFGLRLVIVSTLRTDIIKPALNIVGENDLFDDIFAEDAKLSFTKLELCKKAAKIYDKPLLMIGDRRDDILAGKKVGAKTVYCTWGSEDNNHDHADYFIEQPKDLIRIIHELNNK